MAGVRDQYLVQSIASFLITRYRNHEPQLSSFKSLGTQREILTYTDTGFHPTGSRLRCVGFTTSQGQTWKAFWLRKQAGHGLKMGQTTTEVDVRSQYERFLICQATWYVYVVSCIESCYVEHQGRAPLDPSTAPWRHRERQGLDLSFKL